VTPRLAHHRIVAPAAAGRDAAGEEARRASCTFLIEAISSLTGRRRLAQARREAHRSADGAHARLSYRYADNLGRWDRLAPASPTNRKYESLAAELGLCWQNKTTDKMGTFGDRPMRVKRQNENALALAEFLENHRAVKRVNYPGLKSHPQHKLACRQMSGLGGVLSFEVSSGYDASKRC
jgi:hypothetical protein